VSKSAALVFAEELLGIALTVDPFFLIGDTEPVSGMVITCLLLEFVLRGDFAFGIAWILLECKGSVVNEAHMNRVK
jgi:hypothetical protein